MSGPPRAGVRPGVVFVFAGHGGQWAGMARDLLDASPLFASQIEACEQALEPHLKWSLTDVLRGKPRARRLQRVDVVQPALFAVTVSLAHLWRACGVVPEAVMGHSQGAARRRSLRRRAHPGGSRNGHRAPKPTLG